jgi:malic enzyme
LTAAHALAEQVPAEYLKRGQLYPSRSLIREVSLHVATQVAQTLDELGLARHTASDWADRINELAYVPAYESLCE